MKKFLSILLAMTLFLSVAACGNGDDDDDNGDNGDNGDKVEYGDYKPGLHLGYTEGNEHSYAYVYVDAEGYIQDIFIDSVYTEEADNGVVWEVGADPDDEETTKELPTTKMSLDDGCGYHMHLSKEVQTDEDGNCYVEGEMMWHEQVQALAEDVVENQGVPSYDLVTEDEDEENAGKFDDDAVSGVSITVDYLITAVENALDQAELGTDESPADFDVPEFDGEGDYEPGIIFGAGDYTDGGYNSVAVGAVNEDGHLVHMNIDSVYFHTVENTDDATYSQIGRDGETVEHGNIITKMSLDYGCGYHMHPSKEVQTDDDGNCYVEGEMMWHEQVQAIADDVIDNQGLPEYSLDGPYLADDADDAVAGVSITVTSYIDAIEDALE